MGAHTGCASFKRSRWLESEHSLERGVVVVRRGLRLGHGETGESTPLTVHALILTSAMPSGWSERGRCLFLCCRSLNAWAHLRLGPSIGHKPVLLVDQCV